MLGVHGQIGARVGFAEPRQLHDRTASRVQDHPFDLPDLALDEVSLASYED